MFIAFFGYLVDDIDPEFPKPGVAGSNPAEGAPFRLEPCAAAS